MMSKNCHAARESGIMRARMNVLRSKTRDPDEWLETAPDFSRPLCADLREWIVSWEPDLTEAIKWNALCYSGRKLVCGLDACKAHAAITFFRGAELPDPAGILQGEGSVVRSIKLKRLDGLNRAALRQLLHAAVRLDDEPAVPRPPSPPRPPLEPPDFFVAALKKNRAAAMGFENLAPSSQREYIVWLTHAKRPETRANRLSQTLAALAGGRKWAQRRG
jgi:hypothetical protein